MKKNSKQVLLVDDDPDDLDLYIDLFKSIDPRISTVAFRDPVKAFSHLQKSMSLPGLTILDYNMPKMTGLDFLKRVRAHNALEDLPVTVVTTGCDPKIAEALLALGAECHQKATEVDDIKKLLKLLLTRAQQN